MTDWSFETFPADDASGQAAVATMRHWLDGSDWRVYIYGPPCTGKTGLSISAARWWIGEGMAVEFGNVRALLEEQRVRFANGKPKAIEHLLLDDYSERLIVLDDLGAERPTEFALETVALIVEHLHAMSAPLIVTTNYAPAELVKRLGHVDLVVGQRIVSRLVEDAVQIRLGRPDLRVRRVA